MGWHSLHCKVWPLTNGPLKAKLHSINFGPSYALCTNLQFVIFFTQAKFDDKIFLPQKVRNFQQYQYWDNAA